MAIEYRITLDDNHQFSYRIELDRQYDAQHAETTPKWTRLEHNQCSNCPLRKEEFSRCPAAVDLHRVIEDFHGLPAVKRAHVWVRTPEREYTTQVGLEEGLRSLLGVIMATSACPVLGAPDSQRKRVRRALYKHQETFFAPVRGKHIFFVGIKGYLGDAGIPAF